MSKIRFVGLDVHAETIAVAVAEAGGGEARSLGTIRTAGIGAEDDRQAGTGREHECCYEAGPTGYVVCWQLTQLGAACKVIAPSLVLPKLVIG